MEALLGITLKDLFNLLKTNKVEAKYYKRVLFLIMNGYYNSKWQKKELKAYAHKVQDIKVEKPLFILGHWRSGTTLLHNLITLDKQFCYPNLFQVSRPHQFLVREAFIEKQLAHAQAQNRPMDNMQVTFRDPGEDESGLSVLTQKSPLIGWTFPNNHAKYTQYHNFENVPAEELEQWKAQLLYYFKRLTWRYKKPLVLKSPVHTARLKILYEMFPDARFVHIVRDPYTVFLSTQRLYKKMLPNTCLQTPNLAEWDNHIITDYQEMYRTFHNTLETIPQQQIINIKFEELEKDMSGVLQKIYTHLNITGFEQLKAQIEAYQEKNKNYKKNTHSALSDALKEKINRAWDLNFTKYGYQKR